MKSRYARTSSRACARGNSSIPPITIGPTGCRSNSNSVTTPKLPPPPRRPQSRSAFSSALALHDAAVGGHDLGRRAGSAQVTPYSRSSQPLPLPSVSPPTPVSDTRPPVTASPCSCVAASTSAPRAPPWTRAVRASGRPRRRSSARGRSRSRRRRCCSPGSSARRRAPRRPGRCSRPKLTAADHVVGGRAAHDQRRMAVDHAVPDPARLLVGRILRSDHLAADRGAKLLD